MKVLRNGLVVAGLMVGLSAAAAVQEKSPNIILILADDMGAADLACLGHPYIKTPNLDRLAKAGTIFNNFFVNSAVCAPSRVAFMTGSFPVRHNVHHIYSKASMNREHGVPDFLDPYVFTVADALSGAGYETMHIGKWHICGDVKAPRPSEYGFSQFRVSNPSHLAAEPYKSWKKVTEHRVSKFTEWMTDDAIEFIKSNRDSGKPFFINLCHVAVHAVLNPTEEELAVYADLKANPDDFEGWMREYAKAAKNFDSQMKIYAASLTALDKHIGRLLDYLDENGLTQNTVVMFTADNGPEDYHVGNASNAGVGSPGELRGRKRSAYLGGMRTPCIVRWPGHIPAGKRTDAIWSAVDFLPTMAAIGGAALPADLNIDGENCIDALKGSATGRQNPLFWEWKFPVAGNQGYHPPQLCMLDGKWWAACNPGGSRVELYDVTAEPAQRTNVKEQYPEVAAKMVQKLTEWKAEIPERYDPPAEKKTSSP